MTKELKVQSDKLLYAIRLHEESILMMKEILNEASLTEENKKIARDAIKKHKDQLKKLKKKVTKLNKKFSKNYKKAQKMNNEACKLNLAVYESRDSANDGKDKNTDISNGDLSLVEQFFNDGNDTKNESESDNKTEKLKRDEPKQSAISNKSKSKRLILGKDVNYTESVEFTSATIEELIEIDSKHKDFPYRAAVIFEGNTLGYFKVVSDKISVVESGTVILDSIKETNNERLKKYFEYHLIKEAIVRVATGYRLIKDISFSNVLDAIMFITGGTYGINDKIVINRIED